MVAAFLIESLRGRSAWERPRVLKAAIVVPVYNSARSIQRCLDSLLAQSERSIQVVCVNDGSTDDSLNVLLRSRRPTIAYW